HGEVVREVQGAAVQGRNVRFVSLLTMGECWHNNHHAYPGSARLGLAPGEWDPGWWVLCALRRIGLVSGIRLPDDLPYRPELRAPRERVVASQSRAEGAGADQVKARIASHRPAVPTNATVEATIAAVASASSTP
ncbi:MAG TPA: hypothetical protein VM692_16850, partial [Gammaproteobacteria bacterium]|nr:hypothetical protein [Gammaproteobacteria bacterium]